MQFIINKGEDGHGNVIAFSPSRGVLVADDTHANYDKIVEALVAPNTGSVLDDDAISDLFDATEAIAKVFAPVSERVSVANGEVYFDGDAVDDSIASHIVRALTLDSADTWRRARALALFMEKVAANPSERSREQLYDWLDARDFTITSDGNVLMYKGVRSDLTSIHAGPAVVNGEQVNGNVPNTIGAVVEFPRAEVDEDPGASCSVGLHAGTFQYAESFGHGTVLTVVVNPRDVVSVPSDSGAAKVRVCRYTVLAKTETQVTVPVFFDYEVEEALDDWDDEDETDDWGDDRPLIT